MDILPAAEAGYRLEADLDALPMRTPDIVERPLPVLRATFYGTPDDGYGYRPGQLITASGEVFDPSGLTAASRLYRLGSRLTVCFGERCVGVVVNDRCACEGLDLSRGAFEMLAPLSRGVIVVEAREAE